MNSCQQLALSACSAVTKRSHHNYKPALRAAFSLHSTSQSSRSAHQSIIKRYKRTAGALDAALKGKGNPLKVQETLSTGVGGGGREKISSIKKGIPPIIPSPPPPPPKKGIRRYIFPISLVFIAAVSAFVLTLEDEEDDEFWKDVESGKILLSDDDDDDDENVEEEEKK